MVLRVGGHQLHGHRHSDRHALWQLNHEVAMATFVLAVLVIDESF